MFGAWGATIKVTAHCVAERTVDANKGWHMHGRHDDCSHLSAEI